VHLRAIDAKLHALSRQGPKTSDADATERRQIQEERQSAKQCLNIRTAVAVHIEQIQSANTFENFSTPKDTHQAPLNTSKGPSSARLLTARSLKARKETIASSTAWLTKHLQDLDNKLVTLCIWPLQHLDTTEKERIQEEIDSVKQCWTVLQRLSQLQC
jgi:hypothetical protein